MQDGITYLANSYNVTHTIFYANHAPSFATNNYFSQRVTKIHQSLHY
jgi:hypothetical protein